MSDRITIGIVRLSVEENGEDRAQLVRHLKGLVTACASELFYDIASRKAPLSDRPGLQQAIALIETGTVARLITPDVSRLTADQTLLEHVIEIGKRHDCEILPLNLGLDIRNSTGKLIATITAAGAEYELSSIQDRLHRSSKFERTNNLWRGGIRFGMRKRNGNLEPDTQPFLCLLDEPEKTKDGLSKAQIALHQIELFEQLRSATQTVAAIHEHYGIARSSAPTIRPAMKTHLKPAEVANFKKKRHWLISVFSWSESGFLDWISDPVLCGDQAETKQEYVEIKGKAVKRVLPKEEWTIVQDTHTGLISRERHESILRIIAGNRTTAIAKGSGTYASVNLYKGRVFCGECGNVCHMQGNGSQAKIKKYLYQCVLYMKERARLKHNPDAQLACTQKRMVRVEDVEEAVLQTLVGEAARLLQLVKQEASTEEGIPEPLEAVELRKQIEQYRSLNDPDLKLVIEAKQAKLNRILIDHVATSEVRQINELLIIKQFRDRDFWDFLEIWEKKEVIDQLINRIEVLNGKVISVTLV